jgi:hypothetical protein
VNGRKRRAEDGGQDQTKKQTEPDGESTRNRQHIRHIHVNFISNHSESYQIVAIFISNHSSSCHVTQSRTQTQSLKSTGCVHTNMQRPRRHWKEDAHISSDVTGKSGGSTQQRDIVGGKECLHFILFGIESPRRLVLLISDSQIGAGQYTQKLNIYRYWNVERGAAGDRAQCV